MHKKCTHLTTQVGVNSPFKSGADYWRESSEPSRLSMDGTDGPQMPALAPVGRLFDFRAMMGPEATTAESAKSSLPSMPDWLYRRPHLTGEDILKVLPPTCHTPAGGLSLTKMTVQSINLLSTACMT